MISPDRKREDCGSVAAKGESLSVEERVATEDVPRGTTEDVPAAQSYDVVVIGQGLSGTALAWHLQWLGQRVLILDRDETWTSSKVAAGLVTPITGKKLIRSWRFAELWPVALEFYRRIETLVDQPFFQVTRMLRLFVDQAEGELFQLRRERDQYRGIEIANLPSSPPASINVEGGGFEMSPCGRLDVAAYLGSSRRYFERIGAWRRMDLDVSRETELTPDGVRIPSLNVTAKRLAFCQGAAASSNEWFRDVVFKPAKGEVLCVRIPGIDESRIVHRGVWLVPQGDERFRVGSTYDWDHLDAIPTPAGREEILTKLSEFLSKPVEVTDHLAGVRPIHRNQFPILGCHPNHPQLCFLNGLGSKGTLHAPYFARQLALHLVEGQPIEAVVDLNRRTRWKSANREAKMETGRDEFHVKRAELRPLTMQAQLAVKATVQPGDFVIDATAGNGHDTQFLAELVGSTGRVLAFDIQEVALGNTRRRLEDAGLTNVELVRDDHAEMLRHVRSDDAGRVAAVMFNLGYLPGGDRQLITQPSSSGLAIRRAIELLKPGGVITILAYTGHDGGASEAKSVEETLSQIPLDLIEVTTIESPPGKRPGPRMFHVKRR